jgi:RNA polymerase sigma-70 factor, ECF subfamily
MATTRAEPARAEPARAEPARAEPARAEPAGTEPARAEPAGREEARAEPAGREDFARLTEPLRPGLLAHCYRMLGSVHDAEDQVQETLIRAWRSYDDFEGRASLRTWLYRIATNACLRALENRARRPLPSGLGGPGEDAGDRLPPARPEVAWLEPFPDALLAPRHDPAVGLVADPADPAAVTVSRASLRLALIAALQHLPPRQRAVLILRDVLEWRAAEVAGLLGTSATAVNSMLQRAREQLRLAAPDEDSLREPDDPRVRELLARYAAAFENADVAALTSLLREDAELQMPPQPAWFAGRDQVAGFLAARVLLRPGDFRLIPTTANGQPALATYQRDGDGVPRAHGIQVLTVSGTAIAQIVSFNDPALLAAFGFPPVAP